MHFKDNSIRFSAVPLLLDLPQTFLNRLPLPQNILGINIISSLFLGEIVHCGI